MLYSDRVNQAIRVACLAHDGQYRRNSHVPYVAHPIAVALISQRYLEDENTFIACLFHDIIEDVSSEIYSPENMSAQFGDEVLKIVRDVSEPTVRNGVPLEWQARKDAYLEHLSQLGDIRPLVVSASDKIHNMSEMIRDHGRIGEEMWGAFFASKERELWFFKAVYEILSRKTGMPQRALDDYRQKLDLLSKVVHGN